MAQVKLSEEDKKRDTTSIAQENQTITLNDFMRKMDISEVKSSDLKQEMPAGSFDEINEKLQHATDEDAETIIELIKQVFPLLGGGGSDDDNPTEGN